MKNEKHEFCLMCGGFGNYNTEMFIGDEGAKFIIKFPKDDIDFFGKREVEFQVVKNKTGKLFTDTGNEYGYKYFTEDSELEILCLENGKKYKGYYSEVGNDKKSMGVDSMSKNFVWFNEI